MEAWIHNHPADPAVTCPHQRGAGEDRGLCPGQTYNQCTPAVQSTVQRNFAMFSPKTIHVVTALILICSVQVAQADDNPTVLFDFSKPDAAKQWQTVNDGVMGGVSDGQVRITDQGIMEFYGTLSLENNGGFASVRSKSKPLALKDGDVIVARLRGDGREYYLNATVPTFRIAFSYRTSFKTKAG